MDLGLKGKVALITGAGSQIGYGKGAAMVLADPPGYYTIEMVFPSRRG